MKQFMNKHDIDPDMLGVAIWIVAFILLFIIFGAPWLVADSNQWMR